MKLKSFIYTGLVLIIITALSGWYVLRNLYVEKPVDTNRTVYIDRTNSGFRLIRNGESFHIRGAAGDTHFRELAETGGNTVRIFSTSNLGAKLDEAHENGLAVIVDIYLPYYSALYYLYEDEEVNRRLKQNIRDLVNEHKDHPALLIWNLGNEINYPLVLRKNNFIRMFNKLVSIVQETDPNHPVSTSIIGAGRKRMISVFTHSPKLDIIAFNTFNSSRFVNSHVAQVALLFGPRPYFISEFGPDGPWESVTTSWSAPIEQPSTVQADRYWNRSKMFSGNEDSANLGTLFFYWGDKLERTHTWFSLFKDGVKSEIVNVIKALWNDSETIPRLSGLNYMLLNERGAQRNIIFAPGELSRAKLFFHKGYSDSLRIEWEIYPEAWYSDICDIVVENYEPIETCFSFGKNEAVFRAPLDEGPYRIFAYVYNDDGTFATTNIPFYVLNNQ